MKNTCLTSLFRTGLVIALTSAACWLQAATVGEAAPDFTLTDLAGKTHRLADYKGKTVVLEWVNPDCPFVVKHYEKSGNIPATQKAAVADGVVWLAINSAAPGKQGDYDSPAVKAWLTKNAATPTAYLRDQDGKTGKSYGAKTTPHLFIVNGQGTLVYAGAMDSKRSTNAEDIKTSENYVKSALGDLKAGRPVATPSTQAYGCSVKY